MVKLLDTLFALALLAILTHNKSRHNSEYDMDLIRQIDSGLAKGPFIDSKLPDIYWVERSLAKKSIGDEWVCNSSIFYTSELTLRRDGTFKFHDRGCTSQTFTEGKWTQNDSGFFLTSFDAYKPIEKALLFDTAVGISLGDFVKDSNHLQHLTFVGFTDTLKFVFPGPNDTTKIYFNKIWLQAIGDTLFCFDESSPLAWQKFSRPNLSR